MFATNQTSDTSVDTSATNDCGQSTNILNLVSDYQLGMPSSRRFKSKVRDLKVKQLSRAVGGFEVENCDAMCCKFLRISTLGRDSLIGVWKNNESDDLYHSVIHLKFQYNPPTGNAISEPIFLPVQDGPFTVDLDVTDFLSTSEKECFLYVIGNTNKGGKLLFIPETYDASFDEETEMEFPNFVYSVAVHYKNPVVAVGSEHRCYLYDSLYEELDVIELPNLPGNVYSLAFDKKGNTLYCGCDEGELTCFDLRMDLSDGAEKPFNRLGVEDVIDMKILSNEYLIAFSDTDGDMGVMDIRMRRAIFCYPEHRNTVPSRRFSLNNGLDLICATGDDNITRLWSLNTGKLLKKIIPSHKDTLAHSCLITFHRQWFVVEVQNHIITPILIN